jgi:hypothetical protein
LFGLVFIYIKKQSNRIFFLKKIETGSNRPVLVRFFRTKTSLARFFSVWLGFFPVWLDFFSGFFSFGSAFSVSSLKNQTGRVF